MKRLFFIIMLLFCVSFIHSQKSSLVPNPWSYTPSTETWSDYTSSLRSTILSLSSLEEKYLDRIEFLITLNSYTQENAEREVVDMLFDLYGARALNDYAYECLFYVFCHLGIYDFGEEIYFYYKFLNVPLLKAAPVELRERIWNFHLLVFEPKISVSHYFRDNFYNRLWKIEWIRDGMKQMKNRLVPGLRISKKNRGNENG